MHTKGLFAICAMACFSLPAFAATQTAPTPSKQTMQQLQLRLNAMQQQINYLKQSQQKTTDRQQILANNQKSPPAVYEGASGYLRDRLIFSGGVITQAVFSNRSSSSSYTGKSSQEMKLNDAYLSVHGILTSDLSVFGTIDYAPDQVNTTGGEGGMEFEEAYLHYSKHLTKNRFTFDLGKQYLPFGVYQHHPVLNSLTQSLDESIKEAAVVGVERGPWFGSVYAFSAQGDIKGYNTSGLSSSANTGSHKLENGGLQLGVSEEGHKVGFNGQLDWISNLAESKDIYAIMPVTNNRVGNAAAHLALTFHRFGLMYDGSYALKNFSRRDVTQSDTNGVSPMAHSFELNFQQPIFGNPGTFALDYSVSDDSLFLGLPKNRISFSYTYYLNSYVKLVGELLRNHDYGRSVSATYQDSNNSTVTRQGTGDNNVTGILEVSAHF